MDPDNVGMQEIDIDDIALLTQDNEGLPVPSGLDADRPVDPPTGTIRNSTDSGQLERWNGTDWVSVGGDIEILYDGRISTGIGNIVIPAGALDRASTIFIELICKQIPNGWQYKPKMWLSTTADGIQRYNLASGTIIRNEHLHWNSQNTSVAPVSFDPTSNINGEFFALYDFAGRGRLTAHIDINEYSGGSAGYLNMYAEWHGNRYNPGEPMYSKHHFEIANAHNEFSSIVLKGSGNSGMLGDYVRIWRFNK
jgi:hypothetical protein